jgi:large subunit ribosomal protein L10
MATKLVRPEKAAAVKQLKEKIEASRIVILANYRGLKVPEMETLRKSLRENKSEAKVYKNTLVRMALADLNIECPSELLSGPTIFISSSEDAATASKAAANFGQEVEAFELMGGFLDKENISKAVLAELAKLPSRDELIAKTVAGIKAPITNFVMGLSSPIRGFIYVLNSIQTKKTEVN